MFKLGSNEWREGLRWGLPLCTFTLVAVCGCLQALMAERNVDHPFHCLSEDQMAALMVRTLYCTAFTQQTLAANMTCRQAVLCRARVEPV